MRSKRKFNKTKEWLIQEYIIKNRNREEIAKECGLTIAGLKSILKFYNLKKDKVFVDIEKLKQLLAEKYSVKEIIQKLNSSQTVIYKLMKKYSLTINYIPKYSRYNDLNDDLICSYYLDGFTPTEIGEEINLSPVAVRLHLKHSGIPLRSFQEALLNFNNKILPKELKEYNLLYDLYINKSISKKDLGKKFNVDPGTIDTCLKNLNIPIRNNSESKIGINTGSNHPNWQGGITPLYKRLRESFRVTLVPKVLKRDNYTCQLCGAKGKLHVHHIKHFNVILKEILEENKELDPIKDINLLYDIAVKDYRLNDLNNLITYCPYCHYHKIHQYN